MEQVLDFLIWIIVGIVALVAFCTSMDHDDASGVALSGFFLFLSVLRFLVTIGLLK